MEFPGLMSMGTWWKQDPAELRECQLTSGNKETLQKIYISFYLTKLWNNTKIRSSKGAKEGAVPGNWLGIKEWRPGAGSHPQMLNSHWVPSGGRYNDSFLKRESGRGASKKHQDLKPQKHRGWRSQYHRNAHAESGQLNPSPRCSSACCSL